MSLTIHKKIVLDEDQNPVEVIIAYDEWKKIEKTLETVEKKVGREQLRRYAGALHIEEEPLEYQRRMRGEWK